MVTSNKQAEKTPNKIISTSKIFTRSLGAYFPRASAQVQPRPPDNISDLLKLINHLRDRESYLKTQLIEHKLLSESKNNTIELLLRKVRDLEVENDKLILEREAIKDRYEALLREKETRIDHLNGEVDDIKQVLASQRYHGLVEVSGKSSLIKSLSGRKMILMEEMKVSDCGRREEQVLTHLEPPQPSQCGSSQLGSSIVGQSRAPRIPKPPPKRCASESLFTTSSSDGITTPPPPPPPPPPPLRTVKLANQPPPPPPPPPLKKSATPAAAAKGRVKRAPEVVEFYQSLMRRDSRRDSSAATGEVTAANTKDLVGEIENRSAYLLAIKTDVETQGDFINFLIKEVEAAAFTDIEDVVSFVKWLDDELSFLVDERAVLKHFDWPEQKADALREAAFEYSDMKKLEIEASSFKDDRRQPCASILKKIQTLLEKLEQGVYNLSRLRESTTNRFKSFSIPVDWMLDTGLVSQVKLASVKLAMKYMKRVSAELETVTGGAEEEELVIQGVRFAFRVHQFAGGFDIETMRAFEELRDKARSGHMQ